MQTQKLCANKTQRVITGLTNSITGWKRKD